jgi:HlyD family secretion protein
MGSSRPQWLVWLGAAILIGGAVLVGYVLRPTGLAEGFADGNGRVEAVEVDIAAKAAGRIREILVDEGDFVTSGQILARMDTQQLEAQRREAEAQLQQARYAVETAKSQVEQRLSEKNAAQAVLAQRRAELEAARKRLERFEVLSRRGATSVQDLDDVRAVYLSGQAAISAAEAQIAAAEATVITARSQLLGSHSAVQAVQATIERLQADIEDGVLKAPVAGRIQYRVAQPGEVLAGGGKVLNLLDLSNVFMTFFLPTETAGKLGLGSEVRLVLDAAPQFVIPARISYVADVAQFTPKTVETASERQKLMFRVKARIDPELLKTYITQVKTGLPGMAYVRFDQEKPWPAHLQVNLPTPPQTTRVQP